MTGLAHHPRPNQRPLDPQRAQELISCLVGVAHAEVVADPRGVIQEVHVWGTGEFPTQQTVRNVESALRAHMDLALDRSRIRVMLGSPPERPAARAPDEEPATAHAPASPPHSGPPVPEVPSRIAEPAATTVDVPPSRPAATPLRPSALTAIEPDTGDRILYEGYEVANHRTEQSLLKVNLEWRGKRYTGQAHGTDEPVATAESLARATLRALEGIVQTRMRDTSCSLELAGIRFTEAFQYRLVVVVVRLKVGREVLPLSGSVVVRHGVGLAAILATLQAAERRVRALLLDLPEAPEPH